MPPPPAAGPGIAASSAPTTTTTTTPLFSECLPIASTLSCTPYTSRFYINATALSSRYASILPFFAPVSRTDMDSVDGGLAAVAAPSKPGRKSGAQASFASAGPTLTADVWDQIVASVSNPSDAVARYFAIASATSENPAGLFNVDPCMAGSATSSGAALPLDRRTPSIYGGGDFVANHRKSGSVGDSSPGYWGAIAPVIGGVDGRGAGGPMFQRSVLCGYDLFVASAGCNTAEVRHNLEAAAAIESKGAPPSGRTPAPRKSDSTKTRRSKGPPAASSGSGSAASSGPVLPFCSSVCTMVSNSLVEAANERVAANPALAENCLRRRDHPANSMCSSVVDGMRAVLDGLGEDVNSGYCVMGVDDDRVSCGFAASADATASFCASSLSDVPTVNDACCSHVTLSQFPTDTASRRAKFLATSPVLSSLLGSTKAANILASSRTPSSSAAALVSYEWGTDEPLVNDDGIVDLSNVLLYDASDYYAKANGDRHSSKKSSTKTDANVAAAQEARNSMSGYLVSSFLPLSWQKELMAMAAEEGMDAVLNDGDGDVADMVDVSGDEDGGAVGKTAASSSSSAPTPTDSASGGGDDKGGDGASATPTPSGSKSSSTPTPTAGDEAAGDDKEDGDEKTDSGKDAGKDTAKDAAKDADKGAGEAAEKGADKDADKDGDKDADKDDDGDKPAGGAAGGGGGGDADGDDDGDEDEKKPKAGGAAPTGKPGSSGKPGARKPAAGAPPKSATKASSPGSPTANSSSSAGLSVGVIIAIVVAGFIALVAIIAGVVVVVRNRRPKGYEQVSDGGLNRKNSLAGRLTKRPTLTGKNGPPSSGGAPKPPPAQRSRMRQVRYDYEPVQPDEIALRPGDLVEVSVHFDDGWATGKNLTSGKVGTFPLTCLEGDDV